MRLALLNFLILAVVLGATDGDDKNYTVRYVDDCDEKYKKFGDHYMCMDDQCYGAVERMPSSLGEIPRIAFVDAVNRFRSAVARGLYPLTPPAKNMKELRWNDELAKFVQKITDSCEEYDGAHSTWISIDGVEADISLLVFFFNNSVGGIHENPVLADDGAIWSFRNRMQKNGRPLYMSPKLIANRNPEMKSRLGNALNARAEYVGCGLAFFIYTAEDKNDKNVVRNLSNSYFMCYLFPGINHGSGEPYYEIGDPECEVPSLYYEGLCSTQEKNKMELKRLPCDDEDFAMRENNSIYCRGEQFFYDYVDEAIPYPYVKCDVLKHKIRFWLLVAMTVLLYASIFYRLFGRILRMVFAPIKIFLV
ncbi:venom allergen 5-like [Cloeon dipterum]|uniref:venom allergen 5-like n=1 Tax=Cloeon dipterum TaxID=197152 RepID=UPI00321F66DE